jgi:hypothetical protein
VDGRWTDWWTDWWTVGGRLFDGRWTVDGR